VWTKLKIVLSRIDHFFGDGLSSLSFLFPPNQKHDVLDLSVLNIGKIAIFPQLRRTMVPREVGMVQANVGQKRLKRNILRRFFLRSIVDFLK
jgi:hypothetical protein